MGAAAVGTDAAAWGAAAVGCAPDGNWPVTPRKLASVQLARTKDNIVVNTSSFFIVESSYLQFFSFVLKTGFSSLTGRQPGAINGR
jgi:hypothetical protein